MLVQPLVVVPGSPYSYPKAICVETALQKLRDCVSRDMFQEWKQRVEEFPSLLPSPAKVGGPFGVIALSS